jgi:hypothetical protein
VHRLKDNGETFLDLGCCVGQDFRKLVYDRVPLTNLWESGLCPGFFDLGYVLFRDKIRLASRFVGADIFDQKSDLARLEGKVDVLYAASFINLFGWDRQVAIYMRIVQLMREVKGV